MPYHAPGARGIWRVIFKVRAVLYVGALWRCIGPSGVDSLLSAHVAALACSCASHRPTTERAKKAGSEDTKISRALCIRSGAASPSA